MSKNSKNGEVAEKGRGQPTKLTPEIQKTICEAIRAGSYVEIAVVIAGIHRSTFYRWLKRGDDLTPPNRSKLNERIFDTLSV